MQRVHRAWRLVESAALDNLHLALDMIAALLEAGDVTLAEAIIPHGLSEILQAMLKPNMGVENENLLWLRTTNAGTAPLVWPP